MRSISIRLEKRQTVSLRNQILNPILFVLLGLVLSSISIAAIGISPFAVYAKMVSYSFLNLRGINGSIEAALPLILCGLSVSLAFQMNLNNIGAEGQYAMGAIIGGAYALFGPSMATPIQMILMFLLCAMGGAVWALIAGLLKAHWNVNETIVTLMLNYIALLFLDYLCYGPWMAPKQTTAISEAIPKNLYLPDIAATNTNSGILLVLVIAIALTLFLHYTTAGYQIHVIKSSLKTAEYAGIHVKRYIILVLALSGAIAGLAGFVQVTGVVHRVQAQLPGGSGYTGIVIAYLSRFHPLTVILVSILFGGLINSCAAVQIMGVPSQIATMIQGCIMIAVIAGEFFNHYQISVSKKEHTEWEVAE